MLLNKALKLLGTKFKIQMNASAKKKCKDWQIYL